MDARHTTTARRLPRRALHALAVVVALALVPVAGVVVATPALAQTASWYTGNAAVSQNWGCTAFTGELVQSWRHCPASAPRWHSGIDLTFRGLPGADANGCGSPIYAPVALTV